MPNIIDDLEFKYYLNRELRHGKTFEDLFATEGFAVKFADFLKRRIGQIWLRSEIGRQFQEWQDK